MKKLILSMFAVIGLPSYACTTIIVGKDASDDGSIIIARNSDTSSANRAKHFKIYPHSKNTARFLALPYYNTEAHDGMLQVATNQYGVAMSATETITSNDTALKYDPFVKQGVSEMNITKSIMEKAKTAKDAIAMIGQMIESNGASEGFGIAVADKNEAWYLETASGKRWVAFRIPSNSYFVSANQGRIQEVGLTPDGYKDGYMGSDDLISFAKTNGFYKEKNGRFDFRETYQRIINVQTGGLNNDINYNYIRIATVQNQFSGRTMDNYQSGDFPTTLTPTKKISEQDVEQILSNYYQGTDMDPYTNPESSAANYRPISVFRSSNSHVTVVRDNADTSIANIEYIAMGMPSLSIYVPFYYGISKVPHEYTIGDNKADSKSAFWRFRKLQSLVFLDFAHYEPAVRQAFAKANLKIRSDQYTMEKEYQKHPDPKMIQKFTDDSVKYSLAVADGMTKELEADYIANHKSVKFTNDNYTKLTNDIFLKYKFPGF